MLRQTRTRAQATIDYLILFSVIVAAIIIGASAFIKPAVDTAMNNLGNVLNQEMTLKEE